MKTGAHLKFSEVLASAISDTGTSMAIAVKDENGEQALIDIPIHQLDNLRAAVRNIIDQAMARKMTVNMLALSKVEEVRVGFADGMVGIVFNPGSGEERGFSMPAAKAMALGDKIKAALRPGAPVLIIEKKPLVS